MLVWLYEQLQQQREEGTQQRKIHDDRTRDQVQEQENEAQFSFLCGNLSVLFGLLMMGGSGAKNRGAILGSGIGPVVPHPTSRLQLKRERKGERQRRNAVDEDEDQEDTTGSTRLRLARLVDQAREFGAFYNIVSRRMTRMAHGHGYGYGRADSASAWGGFVGFDVGGNGIVDAGGGGEGGEEGGDEEGEEQGGSKVVQHVVEFLEGLRDD